APREPPVDAFVAPSADDVVAFGDLLEEARDLGRIVLEVAIHRDGDVATGEIESRLERRRLAEVAPQHHDDNAVVALANLCKNRTGAIATAVVDEHHLVRLGDAVHDLDDLGVEST